MMKNPRNGLGLTLTWWSFLTCDDHKSVKFTEFSDGGWSQFDIGFRPGNIWTGAATSQWDRGESEKWEKGVSCHSQFLSSVTCSLAKWLSRCCVPALRIPVTGSRPPPTSRWGRPGQGGRGAAGAWARGRAPAPWGAEWSPTSQRPRPVRGYSARKNVMHSNVSLKGQCELSINHRQFNYGLD